MVRVPHPHPPTCSHHKSRGSIHVAVHQCCIMAASCSPAPCAVWMRVSMRCTYLPSSPGLLPWQHLHDCSSISAPAQPCSCLIQILWLCLFTTDPFLRPSLYSSHKQSPPPVYPLSLSQPFLNFPPFFFFLRTHVRA